MFALKWLVDHDVLPKDRLEEYYASYVAGIFRTVRFGTGEAHGRAEMMEFNYLLREQARDSSGRYAIDYHEDARAISDAPRSCSRSRPPAIAARGELVSEIRNNAGRVEVGAQAEDIRYPG